jgi:adenylate cyclase
MLEIMTGGSLTLEELVRAGSLLSRDMDFTTMTSVLVEQSLDITRSDLACLYIHAELEQKTSSLRLIYRRGRYPVSEHFSASSELVAFIEESDEAVVLTERQESPFAELLLHPRMLSGIALPLSTPKQKLGLLILNSRKSYHYGRERFLFLDSFCKLAGGMLHNARLFQDLREYLARIQALERYQENIFSSMTNLLVTTDQQGRIRYFNSAAARSLGLTEAHLGTPAQELFREALSRKIVAEIVSATQDKREVLNLKGIYRCAAGDMDFNLNISPLLTKRGRTEGATLLFTDQTREQELAGRMKQVVEERRLIKDMFSRYLSTEIVRTLMDTPDLVKPGGSKKEATIFFADIRGYTSFSEGRDPAYIIGVLNDYFSEAVEVVIRHRGYIDKFIGDAIMAAWGVPLQTVAEDAVQAVACSLEIQDLVRSKRRSFFKGDAANLKIGIGMHTGPIVAGNLGSSRRMNYTVIGDTVNVAARLEGVAGPDEVIITQTTRDYLGERFRLEERKPVRVKGKSQPLHIFRVLKQN